MNDENDRVEVLLNRMAFQMERWAEISEANTARMRLTLARAGEIAAEQKRMADAITKLEQKYGQ